MSPVPEGVVCRFGHVATTRDLMGAGASPGSLAESIRLGWIRRAARGVYVCRHADPDQLTAARAHARIDCVSVLRRAGVWAGMDTALHLRTGMHSSVRQPDVHRTRHIHWARPRFELPGVCWSTAPVEALVQAIRCLDEEHAIAALESAVHEGFISLRELRTVCDRAPGRLSRGISEIEHTPGSGLETIVRRRLRHDGYRVVAQGYVPGVGHQDLVVEDVLGLEIDGGLWHATLEQHEVDRDRDTRSSALGRGVIRLSHSGVLVYWETSLAAIERAVADARDLQRFRGR